MSAYLTFIVRNIFTTNYKHCECIHSNNAHIHNHQSHVILVRCLFVVFYIVPILTCGHMWASNEKRKRAHHVHGQRWKSQNKSRVRVCIGTNCQTGCVYNIISWAYYLSLSCTFFFFNLKSSFVLFCYVNSVYHSFLFVFEYATVKAYTFHRLFDHLIKLLS